jgi:peptide/nickel transport system permease protein
MGAMKAGAFAKRLWNHPRGRIGVAVTMATILIALLAAVISPSNPYDLDDRDEPRLPPSVRHFLGTDTFGNDVLSKLIYGTRVSLTVGLVTGLCTTLVGGSMGILAGYVGGLTDNLIMRLCDVLFVIPGLPLMILLANFFGTSYIMLIVIFTILGWAGLARLIRSQVLSLRTREFVQVSEAMGAPKRYVMLRHILPAVSPLLIVDGVLASAGVMVAEAGLSFLGFGDPRAISWGKMLYEAQAGHALLFKAWWWVLPPGLAIFVTALGFMMVGYALEDLLNPHLRSSSLGHRRSLLLAGSPRPVRTPASSSAADNTESKPILEVTGLWTYFHTPRGTVKAVDGVDFSVYTGEMLALVGESGSGKSVSALSITRLLQSPPGEIVGGQAVFGGRDLLAMPEAEVRSLLGKEIAMVFQEPMTSLNPVYTIGFQVAEPMMFHEGLSREAAMARVYDLLAEVGIPDPVRRAGQFPHELSGGMRQRATIAMAIALNPKLLIADEPTTALDVTIQAQVLELLKDLAERRGLAVILITHDFGVVSEMADRVLVMYAGQVVEEGRTTDILDGPAHPYTKALLRSVLDIDAPSAEMYSIPGTVPDPTAFPPGCRFCPRCSQALEKCGVEPPPEVLLGRGRKARCHRL